MDSGMKAFVLYRHEDEGGVSGIGEVAERVQFSNGKCVVSWLTEYTSIVVYDDIKTVEKIHGHGGKTEIVWK
jgi:hypothetical protein